MISEELKSQVESLNQEERHELSILLTKLELESDETYWEAVRKRSGNDVPDRWVAADRL